jgi:signal transduction histidine kinase
VETRALTARIPRSAWAAAALVALLAVLLGAWFVSGWHDVQMRQAELRAAPHTAAHTRARELARELHAELDALRAREVRRPYFHYQNLMHDPRAPGAGVTPSPLARGPEDRLVRGYFQIDARGRASTPTINDDVPELSDTERLLANRAFRELVARDLVRVLGPHAAQPVLAEAEAARTVYEIDGTSYAQNMSPNPVYWQQLDSHDSRPRVAAARDQAVTITISPLEWRTHVFGGVPSLVAVRDVQTPDGALVQGFVVDRATVTGWLADKAGDMVAELRADAAGVEAALSAAEVAPGWRLTVAPNPRVLASAATDSIGIARGFVVRFVATGAIALVVAAFVLLLVMRAERLARERSQFAAAAAHELRTPLAGLQLYGDMLADGLGDPDKLRDYARRMSEEASRLGRVVSNVLGFSQLERGNLSIESQAGVLGEVLRELAEQIEPTLDRAAAALELDVPPELRARFDRDALARIVGNLVDNAEKYTRGADDRTIRLSAREVGDHVEVVVGDHGPGIAEPARLFRPFARGVASDGPAGLGLGLALSRSLAHAMGGELSYRAAYRGGADLVLRLPRA